MKKEGKAVQFIQELWDIIRWPNIHASKDPEEREGRI